MAHSKFGWSYPPGAANDPLAPYNQEGGPCEVCGQNPDGDCQCSECPIHKEAGNPACYPDCFWPRPWHILVPPNRKRASLHDAQGKTIAEELDAELAYWIQKHLGKGKE